MTPVQSGGTDRGSKYVGSFGLAQAKRKRDQMQDGPLAQSLDRAIAAEQERIVQDIQGEYDRLSKGHSDTWVKLKELRPKIRVVSGEDFESAMKEASRVNKNWYLAPQSGYQFLLTKEDHENAVRIGGDNNHQILIKKP